MGYNQSFDKMQFLRTAVSQFINKPSAEAPVEAINRVYLQLVNQLPANIRQHQIRRNILEKCRDLFLIPSFRETIFNAQQKGTPKTELVSIVVNQLAFRVLGRHYDMSNLCCEGMISSVTTPNEIAQKDSSDQQEVIPAKPIKIKDMQGNRILIQYLNTINYTTGSIGEYINKYKIFRYIGEEKLPPVEVYTELDFTRLSPDDENSEYYRAVANHLLSIENIQHSNANGYIGGLTSASTTETGLKVGEEYFEREGNNKFSSYTYQISPHQALYFDRIEKEAVISYLEKTQKRDENDGR